MENEIERMRQQLAEANRLKDEDDLRAQLQKTDEQREQMVQHINVSVKIYFALILTKVYQDVGC